MTTALADPAAFIVENTRANSAPLVPEIQLYLADEIVPIWQLTEEELKERGLPPPFWAFAWAGGQAIARYILDEPMHVEGKTVLDFAAGCGIAGLAAAKAGASHTLCADIDPFSTAACELNARLSGYKVETTTRDLVGSEVSADVILAGDICYEQPLANRVADWLRALAAQDKLVLIGDPGRTYLPKTGLEARATYHVETSRELEDNDVRRTTVFRVLAP